MNIIEKEFETRDVQDTYFSNLSGSQKEEYLKLYEYYNRALVKYLCLKADLQRYDDTLKSLSINIKKVDENDMDIYQLLSSQQLTFLYIRNNLYLDRLTPDELTFLKEKMLTQQMDNEVMDFIAKTFKKVIASNDKMSHTFYGPEEYPFVAPVNALVIGMRFDEEFKAPKEKNKVWKANNSKAIQALEIIKRAMQEEIAEKIDYPVCAIKYNSSSIQKRNELQIDKYKV